MTVDIVNNIVIAPFYWAVLSVSVLILVQRSRNTSASTLHTILFLTLAGGVIIPLSRSFLPAYEWAVLPEETKSWLVYPLWPNNELNILHALALGYCAVVLVLWARIIQDLVAAYRLLANSSSALMTEHQLLLSGIQKQLNIPRTVKLRYSTEIMTPVTLGYFRPYVLLPLVSRSWSSDMTRQFLFHELTHIRRGDWLCLNIAKIFACTFWCIPTSWLVLRSMRWFAELACDDCVVSITGDRALYAQNLLRFAQTATPCRGVVSLIERSDPFQRISYILDGTRIRVVDAYTKTLYTIVLMLFLLLGCVVKLDSVAIPEVEKWQLLNLVQERDETSEKSTPPGINTDQDTFNLHNKSLFLPGPSSSLAVHSVHSAKSWKSEPSAPQELLSSEVDLADSARRLTDSPKLKLTRQVKPKYPTSALRRKREGVVSVTFEVFSDGSVGNIQIDQSSGYYSLDLAALKAVKRYRYEPPILEGDYIGINQVTETFQFQLKEGAN